MAMIITRLTTEELLILADVWTEHRDVLDAMVGALQSGDGVAPIIGMLPPEEWKALIDKTLAIVYDGDIGLDSPMSDFMKEMNANHETIGTIYQLLSVAGFLGGNK